MNRNRSLRTITDRLRAVRRFLGDAAAAAADAPTTPRLRGYPFTR